MIQENEDVLNNIFEVKNESGTYKTWSVEFIKSHVIEFLKEKYPDSLILSELNKIDLTIFDNKNNEIIPVEIQKSTIFRNKGKYIFNHAEFEDSIRRQLNYNIKYSNICWFFFDAEYLRYLQSGNIKRNAIIDMEWIIELMEENKLKVFSIKYDGLVKELTTRDFDFIKISENEIVLNKNKLKIFRNVVNGYNFNQDEISKFYFLFSNRNKNTEENSSIGFFTKSDNKRCKLYGNILQSIASLVEINNLLDMNSKNRNDRYYATYLGIFEVISNHNSGKIGNHMKFVDKFDVCKYFPGYLRREKIWDVYKDREMGGNFFSELCIGRFINIKSLLDY